VPSGPIIANRFVDHRIENLLFAFAVGNWSQKT
jgi:hypothetical protein